MRPAPLLTLNRIINSAEVSDGPCKFPETMQTIGRLSLGLGSRRVAPRIAQRTGTDHLAATLLHPSIQRAQHRNMSGIAVREPWAKPRVFCSA